MTSYTSTYRAKPNYYDDWTDKNSPNAAKIWGIVQSDCRIIIPICDYFVFFCFVVLLFFLGAKGVFQKLLNVFGTILIIDLILFAEIQCFAHLVCICTTYWQG